MTEPSKELTIDDLNRMYMDAEEADASIFAEQRSNVLLITGEHYANRGSKYFNSIRDQRDLSKEQKLRLTKNHIQRIVKTYVNNIMTYCPGVTCMPKNETELQDIKAAEMHNAVIDYARDRYKIDAKTRQWCDDFVGIGEVWVKIFWDEMAGDFKGHYQAQDPETGDLQVDEQGQPLKSDQAVFTGDFVFERIYGFNVLRPKEAKDADSAEWLGIRKLTDLPTLLARIKDEDVKKKIQESKDETYVVFDSTKGGYTEVTGQTMLREYYFRPSPKYPMGYYFISTPQTIIWQGELPFGIFPIAHQIFDEIPTLPRGRSIVKVLRPFQAEINRGASKIAEHQITLGDDKLIYQTGAKLTNGALLPGVRGIQVSGAPPTILAGRDGSQYLAYVQSQISEMYQAAMLDDVNQPKNDGQVDPYALLFKAVSQKKQYSLYTARFEQFQCQVWTIFLELARKYYSDDTIIYAVGRREKVNLSEFKAATPLCYQIVVEPQTEDMESKMGKQLTMNHILQYVGPQLGKDDIGKIIANMPYANAKESFSDLTMDYENAKNDILALDRGEQPQPNPDDKHEYIIKRLTSRMKQADFRYLTPQIKQNYLQYRQIHSQMAAQQAEKIKAMEAEFIPIGGAMIACDMYVDDPQNAGKAPKRVRVPYQALDWLIKQMESQGMTLQKLESMQQSAQAGVAGQFLQQQQGMGGQGRPPMSGPGAGPLPGVANGNGIPNISRPGNPVSGPLSGPGPSATAIPRPVINNSGPGFR